VQSDGPYNAPEPTFPGPIQVLTQDPTASPNITVTVPCSYLPFIRGCLTAGLLTATWKTDSDALILLCQERVATLISQLVECSGGSVPFSCPYDFTFSDGGWALTDNGPSFTPRVAGIYVPLLGWQSSESDASGLPQFLQGVEVDRAGTSSLITDLAIRFLYTEGSHNAGLDQQGFFITSLSGTFGTPVRRTFGHFVNGLNDIVIPLNTTADHVYVQIFSKNDIVSGTDGNVTILSMAVNGVGTPFC